MVAHGLGVLVYMSPDGQKWVRHRDYEALKSDAILTVEECKALGSVCSIVVGVLERADGLTPDEAVAVRGWVETISDIVNRLGE